MWVDVGVGVPNWGRGRGRREGEREGRERIFGERERICLAAEEMVRVSEFLPFIVAFLGDDFVKIVARLF